MNRGFRFRWFAGLLVVGLLAAVGVYAYNLGWAQGLAQGGAAVAAPGTVPLFPMYRPWGWGFGFFPFFPFFFILFWFFILRGLFWRRYWWGPRWDERGVPVAFDEWHRRAHAAADQKTRNSTRNE
jgi:hypothetical protein